ncbi:MAG: hypothetical protein LBK53_00235, partial [Heliobacteriaceae bacterium]|nr:hypothetical protein [Heliobacteriaceae bacterium]
MKILSCTTHRPVFGQVIINGNYKEMFPTAKEKAGIEKLKKDQKDNFDRNIVVTASNVYVVDRDTEKRWYPTGLYEIKSTRVVNWYLAYNEGFYNSRHNYNINRKDYFENLAEKFAGMDLAAARDIANAAKEERKIKEKNIKK